MRKYIHVAKAISPTLTLSASELIAEEYAKLRSQDSLQQDNLARVSFATLIIINNLSIYRAENLVCRDYSKSDTCTHFCLLLFFGLVSPCYEQT